MHFNKSTAVVTGGAQGIGLSVVNALLQKGSKVAIWDQNPKAAQAVFDAHPKKPNVEVIPAEREFDSF